MASYEQQENEREDQRMDMHLLSGTLDKDSVPIPPSNGFHLLMWLHNNDEEERAAAGSQQLSGGGSIFALFFLAPMLIYAFVRGKRWISLTLFLAFLAVCSYDARAHTAETLFGLYCGLQVVTFFYLFVHFYGEACRWINVKVAAGAPWRVAPGTVVMWLVWSAFAVYVIGRFFWAQGWIDRYTLLDYNFTTVHGRLVAKPHEPLVTAVFPYVVALVPGVPLAIYLQAWLRRRTAQAKRAVPAPLAAATWIGLALVGVYAAFLLVLNLIVLR